MHWAAHLWRHPTGNRQLLVLVPGPRACSTLLHGSRSESRTAACHPPLLKKDDYFFPAQWQLENRKISKCCWLLLPTPVPSGGHWLLIASYSRACFYSACCWAQSPSATASPLGQLSGFSRPGWHVHAIVYYWPVYTIQGLASEKKKAPLFINNW